MRRRKGCRICFVGLPQRRRARVKVLTQNPAAAARTDRINAEPIARFIGFRPKAGRDLVSERPLILNVLPSKEVKLGEMPK